MTVRWPRFNPDALARVMFYLSIPLLGFAYGFLATERGLFPVTVIREVPATAGFVLERVGVKLPWYYQRSDRTEKVVLHLPERMAPGLRLIGGLDVDDKTAARVVDAHGRIVHSWVLEWKKLWPDPDHLSEDVVPEGNRALVHGMALAPNGDLIFNFDEKGMVRLDPCGRVRWRLPYRTHHSIELDEAGQIWASGLITRTESSPRLPNYVPPFEDFTVLKLSPDGTILSELFVADLLIQNGLTGLLYMSSTSNATRVGGDTLHLNDVDPFPASMTPGVFAAGDVMISLRNINAIVVFDSVSHRVKFVSVGAVLRQHDADFVDGNTISVFDNHNLSVPVNNFSARLRGTTVDPAGHHSRIVRLSAVTGQVEVLFAGSADRPFFTHIMGRQQLLPNGNSLLTEAASGRVLEVDVGGNLVWEYFNLLGDGRIGVTNDAILLPVSQDPTFFAEAAAACGNG